MNPSTLYRPVWAEGVMLSQQHMQAQEAYLDAQAARRYRTLHAGSYGFDRLEFDLSALSHNCLAINYLTCIFENGSLLEFTASPGRELQLQLPDELEVGEVMLALPANRAVDNIDGYPDRGQLAGFRADFLDLPDYHDPERRREVMVALPNISLLMDAPAAGEFDCLPCCRLRRNSQGGIVLDPDFVPPLLNLRASPYLSGWLTRQIYSLEGKIVELCRGERECGQVGQAGAENSIPLLLQVLKPAQAVLTHFQSLQQLHPESLFVEMVRLLAALPSMEPTPAIDSLPNYQHKQLGPVFAALEQLLQQKLGGLTIEQAHPLVFERHSDALYQIAHIDRSYFQQCDFYLAVYVESADTQWIESFANQVKVGSGQQIEMIVASALKGAGVSHCQRPPDRLRIKSGYEYFRLEPFGKFWQAVADEQSLACFVPLSLQQACIELLTVDKE